jgi:drug/metabolite transporter (DMT)-like permease
MSNERKKMILADLAIILMAFIWGSGFAGNKIVLNEGLHPMQLVAIRFVIASIFLCIVFRKKLTKDKQTLKAGFIIGFVLFLSYMFQTVGLDYTTASNNAFLTSIYVIIVPLLAFFITKRAPDKYNLAATFLVLIGIFLLTVDFTDFSIGKTATFKGDMLTLISAVCYAFQVIFIARYTKKHDPIVLAILQICVVAILSTISALIFEGTTFNVSSRGVGILLYLSLAATALCLILQNVAQKYTTPTHAGVLMSLESVFGTLLGVLILKEHINVQMYMGFLVILIALIIAETKLSFIKIFYKHKKLSPYKQNK